MPYHDATDENEETADEKDRALTEIVSKLLWVLIPVLVGGMVSMFSNFQFEIQLVMWAVLAVIVCFGLWAHSAKRVRLAREAAEKRHWSKLMDGLDTQFDKVNAGFEQVDERFDQIESKFDQIDRASAALLRNELIRAHREWVEGKGYITLEALEYIDETYDSYHLAGFNGSGTRIWEDLHNLPIRENPRRGDGA